MITNSNLIKILVVCMLSIVTTGITGCGGSTSGTGGVTVEGRVVELNNVPLGAAQITVLQSGESAVSDDQGNFKISTAYTSVLEFLIEDSDFSVQSKIENIPENAETVVILITVNRKDRSATSETKEIRQREKDENSSDDKSGVGESSSKGGSSSSSGSKNNDDEEDRDDGDSDSEGMEGSSSSSDNSSSSKDDSSDDSSSENGDNSDDDSSDDDSDSNEGKEYQQEGLISAITSSSVTVNGVTFISTTKSQYRDKDGNKATLAAFTTGTRVKVEGKLRNGIIELDKLEAEKD